MAVGWLKVMEEKLFFPPFLPIELGWLITAKACRVRVQILQCTKRIETSK
jgi:hypothetical protein